MATYDTVAEDYDFFYSTPRYQAENERLISHLVQALDVDGLTLDLGCGTGFLLDLLGFGKDYYIGVDISSGMLARAAQKYPDHQFLRRNIEYLPPYWTAHFDNVVCLFEPMNQTADPPRALDEAVRVLKPGGRLFLMLTTELHTQSDILRDKGIPIFLNRFSPYEALHLADGEFQSADVFPFTESYEILRARLR